MIINQGISFGLNFPCLELVSVLLMLGLTVLWWKDKKAWGILLIVLGGGLNLMERYLYGGVRDYWKIPFTSIYNNINDYLIVIGVIQLFWILWKKRQK